MTKIPPMIRFVEPPGEQEKKSTGIPSAGKCGNVKRTGRKTIVVFSQNFTSKRLRLFSFLE